MSGGVPCAGCTLCCRHDLILVHPEMGDDPSQYECDDLAAGIKVLKRAANGDCVYLDRATGCTIYDRRPAICREFDCAAAYKRLGAKGRADALAQGTASKAVLDRGHALLKSGYRPEALAERRRILGARGRS